MYQDFSDCWTIYAPQHKTYKSHWGIIFTLRGVYSSLVFLKDEPNLHFSGTFVAIWVRFQEANFGKDRL